MSLIKCKECGKEISDQALACPNCGCPVTKENINMQQPIVKKKKSHGCLISFLIFIGFIAVLWTLLTSIVSDNSENNAKGSVLATTLNLTDDQEADILDVFDKCGIGEISSIQKFQSGDGHTSYYVTDDEVSQIVVWISDDKTVESIYFHDYDIYVDGEVIAPITNYYVPSENKDEYRTLSQEIIKKLLNYPDTAKFKGITSWKFGVDENGLIIVQSSVTAKNAFNVESTTEFQILYDDKTPTSVILDGKEYLNN
jgi:hypothetical protein